MPQSDDVHIGEQSPDGKSIMSSDRQGNTAWRFYTRPPGERASEASLLFPKKL
jgi:hypothetical protein